ncbi:hypothetical protein ACH4RG_03585 [Streptomyces sp. NPDC021019]|uniref:hypothetical protein n=1 Tax=Streptomyces sp. NPDC021019 TaxID=3365108 RepID=UPI00378D2201
MKRSRRAARSAVIVATTEEDPDPAQVELPDTATLVKPTVTNWSTKRDGTIPSLI